MYLHVGVRGETSPRWLFTVLLVTRPCLSWTWKAIFPPLMIPLWRRLRPRRTLRPSPVPPPLRGPRSQLTWWSPGFCHPPRPPHPPLHPPPPWWRWISLQWLATSYWTVQHGPSQSLSTRENGERQRKREQHEGVSLSLNSGSWRLTLAGRAVLACSLIGGFGGWTGPRLGLQVNLVHILEHIWKQPLIQNLHNKPTKTCTCVFTCNYVFKKR